MKLLYSENQTVRDSATLLAELEAAGLLIEKALKSHCAMSDQEYQNMEGSGARWARAMAEMMQTQDCTLERLAKILSVSFPAAPSDAAFACHLSAPQLLVQRNIEANSLCPHHFLPVKYDVDLAVSIPCSSEQESWVYGLSKYTRAIVELAKRPVLQEQFTKDILSLFKLGSVGTSQVVNTSVAGVAVRVTGEHGCMSCRGIKSRSPSVTFLSTRLMDQDLVLKLFNQ